MSSANKHSEEEDDGDIGENFSGNLNLDIPTLSQINLPEDLLDASLVSDMGESSIGQSFRKALAR